MWNNNLRMILDNMSIFIDMNYLTMETSSYPRHLKNICSIPANSFFILLLIILSSYHQFFCRVPGIDFQKLRFFYFVINLWHVLLFCRNSYANQIFCCHFFAFQSKYNYAYHAIKFFLRNKSNKGKYAQQTSPLLKLFDAYRL